jgi:hypothetical protein
MLARDKSATKPYTIGLTYRVAEVGLICRCRDRRDSAAFISALDRGVFP